MEFRLVLSIIDRSPVSKICTGVRSGTIIFFTGLQLSLLSTCIIKKNSDQKTTCTCMCLIMLILLSQCFLPDKTSIVK
jgi:hypothetical protein